LWRQATDRVLLLHASDGELVSLAGTGVALWDLLVEPMELSELVSVMSRGYGVDSEVVESDLRPVLDELVERQLVEFAS
jgi:hypothetical protein